MKLRDLIAGANRRYRDEFLGEYFDLTRGKLRRRRNGDGLARFIVVEILKTFDRKASDVAQVTEAVRVLERAQEDLEAALQGLRELRTGAGRLLKG